MHHDEVRDERALADLVAAEFANDAPRLHATYLELVERDRTSGKKLKEADKNRKELELLRREKAELTQRLGSANAALDAYRAESARLKADLKRVRGSRTYRLARVIARPASLLRPRPQSLATTASEVSAPTGREPGTVTTGSSSGAPAGGVGQRRLSDYSYDELVARFQESPTPERLGHVLTRAWYHQGLIEEPAAMIAAHPEIVGDLDASQRELAARILAADRIRRDGISLPARGAGPAYVAESSRVLYCVHSTPAFNTNGYSLRTRGVALGLRAAGRDVVVVGRAGYPWDGKADVAKPKQVRHVVEVDGVDYVHLPGRGLAPTPTDHYVQQCADAFVREARMRRPGVIQAASNYRVGLSALIAARRLGVPFVYEVRGLWEITEASDKPGWESTERYRLQSELETLVAREADAVLAITPQTRDELVRRGVPSEKITVAANAVDTAEFVPLPRDESYAAQLGLRSDVPVIGFAGSMVPYEGLDVLVDAVSVLRDRGVDVQVALAGSGSAEGALKEQALERGVNDRVTFLGRVPAADVPRLMSCFDIMPCPRISVAVTEIVSPLKPLEALSSAKAVVLSDVAPHRDIAGEDERRAALFRAGDAVSLADVLERLVRQPDRRVALGRAGRLWCIDERTWSGLGATVVQAHAGATARAVATLATQRTVRLQDLRIGLVADEFTTATLSASFAVRPLDRAHWRDQLEGLDLVLVESAWKGNSGQWHRGVGYYSPDEHRDLVELLSGARDLGIPSVFWNKEDPIHFDRFVRTASLCDHVFTTDADKIVDYAAAGVGTVRSVASLPFYAQPRLHNPLPGARPFEMTASYAGTYYGQRYAARSHELSQLLETARPFGLAIYDRQADVPDSPYRFPSTLAPYVRGSLPYADVIDSYKAHVVNLNVNSVTSSPTMFSRRVIEVAACGGIVLSGSGRGITETLGSAVPTSSDPLVWRALLRSWTTDPGARLAESWLQMRTVLRSHTVDAAMAILARTAGVAVTARSLPTYAVLLDPGRADVAKSIAAQSVPPCEIWCEGDLDVVRAALAGTSITVRDASREALTTTPCDFVARVDAPVGRTWFEDLLLADLYGPWDRIVPSTDGPHLGEPIAAPISATPSLAGLVRRGLLAEHGELDLALRADGVNGVRLLLPTGGAAHAPTTRVDGAAAVHDSLEDLDPPSVRGRRVLVAGHDLKFATGLLEELRRQGAVVATDVWRSHSEHDEARSRALLAEADVVFCEWGLGNAVWYSQHVRPGQRLVVRVHLQELQRPYLSSVEHENVDAYVFVGDLIREAAVRGHGVPSDKAHVVANSVDTQLLRRPKTDSAARTLGLVGIVPARKRLDLALDVLEGLHARGLDHRLRIKGKTPADYPWMANRPEEAAYYDEQFARIERINAARPGSVLLDGHGDDMAQWYQQVGIVLSVSDFESFHLTIADGAASGAMPALLAWAGSDLIYPREWISADVEDLVRRIAEDVVDPEGWHAVARDRFDSGPVLARLVDLTAGRAGAHV